MNQQVSILNEIKESIKNQGPIDVTTEIDFPINDPDEDYTIPDEYRFKLIIRAINENEALKLQKAFNKRKYNKETKKFEVVQDVNDFVKAIFKNIVVGWKNLTVAKWRYFVKSYPLNGMSPNMEIPYDLELAEIFAMEGIGMGSSILMIPDMARNVNNFNNVIDEPNTNITEEDEVKN